MSKKVIYLFGAGATQAVIKDIDLDKGLMTSDIQKLISKKYPKRGIEDTIWHELITVKDIEHLISVLEAQYHYATTEKLRRYYQRALVELAIDISVSDTATLYTVLTDLHMNIPDLDEELLCFITLNYEDILENSIKRHLKCDIDYTILTSRPTKNENPIRVIKLHGSFNWKNSRPVQIRSMKSLADRGNALWIPPGVEKRKDNYPFNSLWGKAKDFLLECDILRIVGCSLSRNDWGLIPILYTVQKFNDKTNIEIEIIDYLQTGQRIKENYSYLNVKNIT